MELSGLLRTIIFGIGIITGLFMVLICIIGIYVLIKG